MAVFTPTINADTGIDLEHLPEVKRIIEENFIELTANVTKFQAIHAVVVSPGSGYQNDDIVSTTDGIQIQITETPLIVDQPLIVINRDVVYDTNPETNDTPELVTGGSGNGLTVKIISVYAPGDTPTFGDLMHASDLDPIVQRSTVKTLINNAIAQLAEQGLTQEQINQIIQSITEGTALENYITKELLAESLDEYYTKEEIDEKLSELPPQMIQPLKASWTDGFTASCTYKGDTTTKVFGRYKANSDLGSYQQMQSLYIDASNLTIYMATLDQEYVDNSQAGIAVELSTDPEFAMGTRIWYDTFLPPEKTSESNTMDFHLVYTNNETAYSKGVLGGDINLLAMFVFRGDIRDKLNLFYCLQTDIASYIQDGVSVSYFEEADITAYLINVTSVPYSSAQALTSVAVFTTGTGYVMAGETTDPNVFYKFPLLFVPASKLYVDTEIQTVKDSMTNDNKSDIYQTEGTISDKALSSLIVGDILSGCTLTFPTNMSFPGTSPYKAVQFVDGSYFGCNNSQWGLFDNEDTVIYAATSGNSYVNPTYVMPDNKVVSEVITASSIYNTISGTIATDVASGAIYADCQFNYDRQTIDSQNLLHHQQTDISRWNLSYEDKMTLYTLKAKLQGFILDRPAMFISSPSTPIGGTYNVVEENGGLLSFNAKNTQTDFSTLSINGKLVWTNDGILDGEPVTYIWELAYGDVAELTRCTQASFYKYIVDPNPVSSKIALPIYSQAELSTAITNNILEKPALVYVNDINKIVYIHSDNSIQALDYIYPEEVSPYIDTTILFDLLSSHIIGDQSRWQQNTDAHVALEARVKTYAEQLYAGSTPVYDYSQPTTVIGDGGLISLTTTDSWTATSNGAIICEVGGLLGVAMVVQKNGGTIWTSPVFLLGLQISGDSNPSPEIQVTTGDIVSVVGVLGVGQTLNITFFPNKGTAPVTNTYTKTEVDAKFANVYTTDQTYSRSEVDGIISSLPTPVDAYTKAESNSLYEPIDSAYTKSESDEKYATKSDMFDQNVDMASISTTSPWRASVAFVSKYGKLVIFQGMFDISNGNGSFSDNRNLGTIPTNYRPVDNNILLTGMGFDQYADSSDPNGQYNAKPLLLSVSPSTGVISSHTYMALNPTANVNKIYLRASWFTG